MNAPISRRFRLRIALFALYSVAAAPCILAQAPSLSSLSVSPATVVGGNNSTGTVTLTSAAPSGGAIVTLSSGDTSAATVPASVTVTAGTTSKTFTVTTLGVGASRTATISGTYASVTRSAILTVNPAALSSISVSPNSVVGGNPRTGTATLNGKAPPGGAAVTLASSNTSVATVPGSVTVPAGVTLTTFTVSTSAVASTTVVTLSGVYAGLTKTASLTVTPTAVLYSLTRSPTSVVGGNASTGTVTLNGGAPPGGAVVTLTSAGPAVASVPANVTVPAGGTAVSFVILTTGVATSTPVSLTGSYGGVPKTASLTVTPAGLSALTVSAASLIGGAPATGTVKLTGEAPSGGLVVTLSSNAVEAAVPPNVTVAAGTSLATFSITTSVVAASVSATLSAIAGPVTKTVIVSLTPNARLLGVSLSSASINGGLLLIGTATLNGPAPSGGAAVALSSSNTARATVPASVTVAAGATFQSFTVTSKTVATSGSTTITASYNGVSTTTSLTVTPASALLSLSLSASTALGGFAPTGTITLNGPAPAGGALVTLTSSNPAAAALPVSATVAAGSASVAFSIATAAVAFSTSVTLSAVYGGVTKTASLTVTQTLGIASVALDRRSVVGGGTATGTVTMSGPAPTGGATVRLFSSRTALASVPASLTIPAGATSATFSVSSLATSVSADALACASYGGVTMSATLTVTSTSAARSVSLSPSSVIGGNPSTGTVTLNGAAPAGGAVVMLLSSDAAGGVPATVSVSAGSTTKTFTVTTAGVGAPTPVEITASYGSATVASLLSINPASLSSISLSPASVVGGTSSTGTVLLNGKAPPGGALVALSSSNSGVASAPPNVTIAAGSSSATFTATTTAVASSTTVTLSAVYAGVTKAANLTVTPPVGPVLSSLTLSPTAVIAGTSATGTVTLNLAAPSGGAIVALSSANASVAAVPANVTVAAGSTSANFTITTFGVASTTSVLVSAVYNSVTKTATLTVNPAALSSLTLSPSSIAGGSPSTGTVTLTGAAPSGGAAVTLSSSNATVAAVPASVTVPAGANSANFTVTTSTVASSTLVTISGTYSSVTKSADLTVTPAASLSTLTLSPSSVLGGAPSTGTVTLSSAAPAGGVSVGLASSNPAVAAVPSSVTVSAGSTTATFTVTTFAVASNQNVVITATHAAVTRTASLAVAAGATLSNLSVAPATVVGGVSSTGTVTLTQAAPAGGVSVSLASPDPGVASLPPTIAVPAGASSATFTVTTSSVAASKSVILSAQFGGTTRSARLWVSRYAPADISAFTVNPTSVPGGDPVTGTVTLTAPAPPGGAVLSLTSWSGSAVVPATLSLTAGQSSASFAIATKETSSTISALLSASHAGVERSVTLTVTPREASSLTLSPSSVTCCLNSTGTIILSAPAPSAGALVSVSSSDAAVAAVPPTVSVPPGGISASFTVTTSGVASPRAVTISARYAATRTATLTVNPGSPAALHALTLSSANVIGRSGAQGTTVTGKVVLTGPAPAGGAVVTLTRTAGPAVIPAAVTVGAGGISANFTITTSETTSTASVTISAAYSSVTKSATLTIHPPAISSLILNPSTIVGGEPTLVEGRINLSGTPPLGIVVALRSSRADIAPVPVAVNAGEDLSLPGVQVNPTIFRFATSGVSSAIVATISASCCGTTQTTPLTVLPASLSGLLLSSPSVAGGSSLTGTVTLNGKAPPGGALVSLASQDSGVASVPLDVAVSAGTSSATFTVATSLVAVRWPVTISATYSGVTKSASLGVTPAQLADLTVLPTFVSGGTPAVGTVTLYDPAPPGGAVVSLTSSDSGAANVPSSVTVPAGAFSVDFQITTGTVAGTRTATLTASYAGTSQTTFLNVTGPGVALLELSRRGVTGGAVVVGTVTLFEPAPAGGATVTLSTSNLAAAPVPASVTVSAGAREEGFTVTTLPVGSSTSVTLSASYAGVAANRTLAVMAASTIGAVVLSASSLVGGAPATGTLTLTDLAPATGAAVSLTSSHPQAVAVPPNVAIYARALTEGFRLTTYPVLTSTTVTVTATWAGGSKTATLTVTPAPALDRFYRDRAFVVGGTISTSWNVLLNSPAPAGGASVSLSSSDTSAATVPASVTVSMGAVGSGFFSITALAVAAPKNVTITASYGGVNRTALVTVTPASALSELTPAQSEIRGSVSVWATLRLNAAAPAGGAIVSLSSSNPSVVTVPATFTIPAGSTAANVTINTIAVTVAQSVTITASYGGTSLSSPLKVSIIEGTLVVTAPAPDTVWSAAGSPYIVMGAMPFLGNLSIEADTTVKSAGFLEVFNATLNAIGTPGDPIVFVGGAPTSRYGASRLEHVVVASGGISIVAATSVLQDVIVSYGALHGITIQGGSVTVRDVIVDQNLYGGGWNGMFVWDGATLDIADTAIRDAGSYAILTRPNNRVLGLTGMSVSGNGDGLGNGIGYGNDASCCEGILSGAETWAAGMEWTLVTPVIIDGTLTIAPGTVVKAVPSRNPSGNWSAIYLQVRWGRLNAAGTSASPITFTPVVSSPSSGAWGCVRLDGGLYPTGSLLQYVTISHAGASPRGECAGALSLNGSAPLTNNVAVLHSSGIGVRVTNTSPTLSFFDVAHSSSHGIEISGSSSSPTLLNSSATGSGGYGLNLVAGGGVSATDSSFVNNANYAIGLETGTRLLALTRPILTGNGAGLKNGIGHRGGTLSAAETWRLFPNVPFDVTENIAVSTGGVLTLEPGMTARFATGKLLSVNLAGKLIAVGTSASPITFTSNAATPLPGDWGGIFFESGASPLSEVRYANVLFGGGGGWLGAIRVNGSSPTVGYSNISQSLTNGISVTDGSPVLDHLTISASVQSGIAVSGSTSSPTITNNAFASNAFGLTNATPGNAINARLNYWGSATGPSVNGPGTGQSVSTGVSYEPWLEASPTQPQFFTSVSVANRTFNPALSILARLDFASAQSGGWTAAVRNAAGAAVRTFTGSGSGGTATWDGKNDSGVVQPKGTYSYRLESVTGGGQTASPPKGLLILDDGQLVVTNPLVSNPFFSPNGDASLDTTVLSAAVSFTASWTVNVRNSVNTVVRSSTGSGTSISYTWDGRNGSATVQPDGTYIFEVLATAGAATASATTTAVLDNALPTAAIIAPGATEVLSNVYRNGATNVDVTGTVGDSNLDHWTLEFGAGATPGSYTLLTSGTAPVASALLATWATGPVTNGLYTLRLQVWDRGGNRSTATRTPTVGNFTLTRPPALETNAAAGGNLTYTSAVPFTLTETLVIKNESGQVVRTLVNSSRAAGTYNDVWNLRNDAGAIVPDGAYFYVAAVTNGTQTLNWDLTAEAYDNYNSFANFKSYSAFRPFNNQPLTLTFGGTPSRTWVVMSQNLALLTPTMDTSLCAQPPNFCPIAGAYTPSGSKTLSWAGVDQNGVFREDLKWAALLQRRSTFSKNAVILFGTAPTLSNLILTPPGFSPVAGGQTVEFDLATFQSQPVTVTLAFLNHSSRTTLRTITLSNQTAGRVRTLWDGRAGNGSLAAPGAYTVTITATDSIGNQVIAQTLSRIGY